MKYFYKKEGLIGVDITNDTDSAVFSFCDNSYGFISEFLRRRFASVNTIVDNLC